MKALLLRLSVGSALLVGVLAAIGHALDVEDPLDRADVILALSGDTGPRTATAVGLWKAGYAPLLLFAGGSEDPRSVASSELMKRDAVRDGVPADAILVEPRSATTDENAARVAEIMRARDLRSAILVTSPYHQRRAAVVFGRTFGEAGLTFRNYPARDPVWDPTFWWASEPARSLTTVELAKLAAQLAQALVHRSG